MVNCSENLSLDVNPDIEGLGIVVGFLATAYLTIFLLVAQYLFSYNPLVDLSKAHNDSHRSGQSNSSRASSQQFKPNMIDMSIYKCRTWVYNQALDLKKRAFRKRPKYNPVHNQKPQETTISKDGNREKFSEVVLSIGDQHTISGIAILVSGYTEMANDLSVYHWVVIIRLAWFTTVTHLAVLSCLRGYLNRRPSLRAARLFFMLCQVVMLLTAIIPLRSGGIGWEKRAACLYHTDPGMYDHPDPVLAGVFLILSFLLRVYKIFEQSLASIPRAVAKFLFFRLPRALIRVLAKLQNNSRRWNVLWHMIVLQALAASIIVFDIYLHILSSMLFEIWNVCAAAVWGTLSFLSVRSTRDKQITPQYKWSYGQVVPMVMLLSPVLVLWDQYTNSQAEHSDTKKDALNSEGKSFIVDENNPNMQMESLIRPPDNSSRHDSQAGQVLEVSDTSSLVPSNSITDAPVNDTRNSTFLERLRIADGDSFSKISVASAFESSGNSKDSGKQFLERIGEAEWFPFLFIQLFAFAIYLNWVILGAMSEQLEDKTGGFLNWGVVSCLLVVIPMFFSSVLFLLYWPSHRYQVLLKNGIDLNCGGILYGVITSGLAITWATVPYQYYGPPSNGTLIYLAFYGKVPIFYPKDVYGVIGLVIQVMPVVLHFGFSILWAVFRLPRSKKQISRPSTIEVEVRE